MKSQRYQKLPITGMTRTPQMMLAIAIEVGSAVKTSCMI
jgi:hypothetical protein